jgi:hypothetical protein
MMENKTPKEIKKPARLRLEIFSEQSLRFRFALARALLNSILDFCSEVIVAADLIKAALSWS